MKEDKIHILGFAGSLRKKSYNRMALQTASELIGSDAEFEIYELDDIPLYNEDVRKEGFPDSVGDFRERIRRADALLIASPEYNHSITGVLKNAIDWVSRPPDQPLNDKPVAIMGATSSIWGTVRSLEHLRQVLHTLNARVLVKPEVLIAHAAEKFDEHGNLTDKMTRTFIDELVHELVTWTRRLEKGKEPFNLNI